MADEKTTGQESQQGQEPPQPAQPGASTALDDDTLIDVKVAGETRKVPLRDVRASYQIRERADQLLERARRDAEQNREANEVGRNLLQMLDTNPGEAVRLVQRFAAQHGYRPDNQDPDATSAGADGGEENSTRVLDQLSAIQSEIRAMQGEREQERLTDQVRQQLERFPIARQSADARKLMELYLTASAASSPNSPLSELADEVHTRIVNLTAGRTEAREQQRNENRAATKTVESAGGTPPLTPPPDINRKTNVREMAEEMLRRGGGDLAKKLGL